jgi:hypothetical protein
LVLTIFFFFQKRIWNSERLGARQKSFFRPCRHFTDTRRLPGRLSDGVIS